MTVEPLARRIRQARQLSERDLLRTNAAFRTIIGLRRERLGRVSGRLSVDPLQRRRRLASDAAETASRNCDRAMDLLLERLRVRITQADRLLSTLAFSDQAILERGYAVVIGADGTLLKRAADVVSGADLSLKFADGIAQATATGARPRTARPGPRSRVGEGQGSLF